MTGNGGSENISGCVVSASAAEQAALEHLWRYFELHANQRFSVFNFYTVLIGFVSAGLGVALQGSQRFAVLGIVLGLLISLLSFVFWKLDQRGSMLIKYAEKMIEHVEIQSVGEEGAIFAGEPAERERVSGHYKLGGLWSFGKSLRHIFLVMALFGIGGATLSGLRSAGIVQWDAITENKPKITVAENSKEKPQPPPSSVGEDKSSENVSPATSTTRQIADENIATGKVVPN